jgi:hypothetical protein
VISTLADLQRSKSELIADNMFLRQQLIVLERQVVRPKLTPHDRCVVVVLANRIQGWREALIVVKLETLLRWRREGFRLIGGGSRGQRGGDPRRRLRSAHPGPVRARHEQSGVLWLKNTSILKPSRQGSRQVR